MLDFLKVKVKQNRSTIEILPSFKHNGHKDLLVVSKEFKAVWNEARNLWSTDINDLIHIVDSELYAKYIETQKRYNEENKSAAFYVRYMEDDETRSLQSFQDYVKRTSNNQYDLDSKIVFSNQSVTRDDMASFKLPYPLQKGSINNYDELIGTLYSPDNRRMIEWAIGSVIAGKAVETQKALVLYGEGGTGKSTVLDIIRSLFTCEDGTYIAEFNAKDLVSGSNQFATAAFKNNPPIAIQDDGDLSKAFDTSVFKSIISHKPILVNEKNVRGFTITPRSMCFMATNNVIYYSSIDDGMVRRLLVAEPTGQKINRNHFDKLVRGIQFELSGIAWHCLEVFNELGVDYYKDYNPVDMLGRGNDLFNFLLEHYHDYRKMDYVLGDAAYLEYKTYAENGNIKPLTKTRFRNELRSYFDRYEPEVENNGKWLRHVYYGFKTNKFTTSTVKNMEKARAESWLDFKEQPSYLDSVLKDCPAQLTNEEGNPRYKWNSVTTTLSDIDTSLLHYVKFDSLESKHIFMDFDLKDANGNKSLELNIAAASKFPPTYAELSKSGAGIHLHYIYDGDPGELSAVYDDSIEIKVLKGGSALRRKLSKCNNLHLAHISSGLPLKKETLKMIDLNSKSVASEKSLITTIKKCLNKEIHPDTTSNIHFIKKILDDAYASGIKYNVSDLRGPVTSFALMSTHQAEHCLALVAEMHFMSENADEDDTNRIDNSSLPIGIFDVEVFKNLFLLCIKEYKKEKWTVLINPSPEEIENAIQKFRLIGYNNLRYDNHIVYAAMQGYNNMQLYRLSQSIINGDSQTSRAAQFREAKNISEGDIFDMCATKKSLKKWEIELGDAHIENKYDWDEPLPVDKWNEIIEYCKNDVRTTEHVLDKNQSDVIAREILVAAAKASGCDACMNDTTNKLTEKIIFQGNKHPQDQFNYPDLREIFPGYEYVDGKNIYRGIDLGFGGYVYARPGYYMFAKTFDVRSMHPNSAIAMNLFGKYYTERFKALVDLRAAIKHNDLEFVRTALGGIFAPFIEDADEKTIKGLAYALKIAINSVYGLTSASFENPFTDISRNYNNIVALRGALFMKTLQDEVEAMGYTVIHIKTDSIKVANPDERIEKFIYEFGAKYGYSFEVEDEFEKLILFDKATLIEKLKDGSWNAVGARFAEPYVKKTLFTHEEITFDDLIQVKSVKSPSKMYLDFNENNPDTHNFKFIGSVGGFVPIKSGCNAGELIRYDKDAGKISAVVGTKGYRWQEAEVIRNTKLSDDIDMSYYEELLSEAKEKINAFVNVEEFCK